MLDAETEAMSGELGELLEASAHVDPRDIPTRFSLLKKMAQSPAHYLEACQQQQDDSIAARLSAVSGLTKRKEAFRFGSACHLLLLGEDEKVAKFTGDRRAGKVWTDFQQIAAAQGALEILNEREYALARAIAEAVRAHPIAMRLLFDGTAVEQRIDWTYNGKACRSTPDACNALHTTDLKTAVSAEPGQFVRMALRLHYHCQAWLYGEAIAETTGRRPAEAYVIAVEKTRPHPVTVLRFTDRALERGERTCRLWSEQLNTCEATNTWPPYLQDVGSFDVDEGLELEFNGRKFEY